MAFMSLALCNLSYYHSGTQTWQLQNPSKSSINCVCFMFFMGKYGNIIYKMPDFRRLMTPLRLSNRTPRGAGGMPSRLKDPNKRLSLHKPPRCQAVPRKGDFQIRSRYEGDLLSIAPSKWPYFDGYPPFLDKTMWFLQETWWPKIIYWLNMGLLLSMIFNHQVVPIYGI